MKNIQELLKDNKFFQQGIENFKRGKIKPLEVSGHWVKQVISIRDWNSHYSKLNSYCLLESGKKEIVAGFLAVNPDPELELLTGEEMRKVDIYRRAHNIYPFVLEETKPETHEEINVDEIPF